MDETWVVFGLLLRGASNYACRVAIILTAYENYSATLAGSAPDPADDLMRRDIAALAEISIEDVRLAVRELEKLEFITVQWNTDTEIGKRNVFKISDAWRRYVGRLRLKAQQGKAARRIARRESSQQRLEKQKPISTMVN